MKKLINTLALAACAAFMLPSCAVRNTEPAALPQKDLTLQLYSIRELIGDSALFAVNHDSVFALLDTMGYANIEAANYGEGKFYGMTPQDFAEACKTAGLNPLSSHRGLPLTAEQLAAHDFEQALQWWDEAIADHKAAGFQYIVTPWGPMPQTLEEAQTMVDYHNAIGEKCAAAGLKYGYHTHSGEFAKIPGTDTVWIDYLVENTKPENMFWQMDVYWAVMAGVSPVEYLKKYPGRFALLHIKDKYDLGNSGMVNFEPIYNAAYEAGTQGFVVEQEGAEPGETILEAVAADARYLRSKPFVK